MSGVADADGAVADEGDWYAALVAGEHVGEWLETCENPERSAGRRERAGRSLAAKVASDRVYADEATEAGAAARLEAALASLSLATPDATSPDARARQTHASLRDALEAARAACAEASGVVASVRELAFGLSERSRSGSGSDRGEERNVVRVRVRELALGRGVGAKLWNAALMLANDLDEHPDWCRGKRVLELGAGVGLCGLLAAKLGAAEVCMTDFEEPLLEALERSARDAEEEDRDEKPEREGGERSPGEKPFAIPRGVARVARCDWREEAAAESEGAAESEAADRSATAASATDRSAPAASKKTPSLLPDETFDFVFGSDLLYEPYHAETLPAVIARRMARNPPGRCRVVGAVRDRAMLDAFATRCEQNGMRVAETSLRGNRGDEWYEGGFVALEMTHAE